MTDRSQFANPSEETNRVSLGDVEGGFHDSTLAGRDVIQNQQIHINIQIAKQFQSRSLVWQVIIAHADGEEHLAEQLAKPIRDVGYEIAYQGTVFENDSVGEQVSKVLSTDGPVVLCGTVKAIGTGLAYDLIHIVRMQHQRCRVFAVQMEKDARVRILHPDDIFAHYWQDPAKAVQDLITSLEKYYPLHVSSDYTSSIHGVEQKYRELALKSCDIINLANLPEQDRFTATKQLELRQLYVALRVRVEIAAGVEVGEADLAAIETRRKVSMGEEEGGSGREDGPEKRLEHDRIPIGLRLSKARQIVILGDPGAGKTTLLRWLTTAYLLRLKQDPDWNDLPDVKTLPDEDWLPILVRCRNLPESSLRGSLDDMLVHTLRKIELIESEATTFQTFLLEKLHWGQALLLIDGLDEIADPALRISFCQQLEHIHNAWPDTPIIVTSRIIGYREMGYRIGRGFEHATIADLSKDDKDDFAQRWCAVTELPERRKKAEKELIHDIHSTDRIEHLTGNPMLLTTLALVKRKVGKLPSRRADLYWEAVQVLLNWRSEVDEPIDHLEALPQLGYLAYEMCNRGRQQLRQDEIIELFERIREEYSKKHTIRKRPADEFLHLLERRTGILVNTGFIRHEGEQVPVFEFRHRTFQEYLAGRSLVTGCFPGRDRSKSLAEHIAPLAGQTIEVENIKSGEREWVVSENWREALRLCVASCNDDEVDSLLQAIVTPLKGEDGPSTTRPRAVLATLCLADDLAVSEANARNVLQEFARQVSKQDGNSPIKTNLAAAALEMVQAGSHWLDMMRSILVEEFCQRQAADRGQVGGLCGMVIATMAPAGELALREWLERQVVQIIPGKEATAIEVALGIMQLAYQKKVCIIPEMIDRLLSILEGSVPAAQYAAAWALAWLNNEKLKSNMWRPSPAQLERIIFVISNPSFDARAMRFLTWILSHSRERDWRAVEPLISRLDEKDSEVQRSVIVALGEIRDTRAVESLIIKLKDPESAVRQAAVTALGQIRDSRAVEPLIDILQKDRNSVTRQVAVGALGMIENSQAVKALTIGLADPISAVRQAAARALSKIELDSEDISFCNHIAEVMINRLEDQDSDVRSKIVEALGQVGAQIKNTSLRIRVVERLIERLKDDQDAYTRQKAAQALGRIKDPKAVEQLIISMNDKDGDVQYMVMSALGEVEDPRAVELLIARLNGSNNIVWRAEQALGKIKDQRAVEPLIDKLNHPDGYVRWAAVYALGNIKDLRASNPLLAKLTDPDSAVRQKALEAYLQISKDKERIDLKLLSRNIDASTPFLDLQEEISEERVRQAAKELKVSEDDVRRRYESLTKQVPLKLAWLPSATQLADPFGSQ